MCATAGEPLVIRSLEFIGGMATAVGWRPESSLPEIAFAGRSNVGKSSLLNRLIHRKKMARVSNTPGRTREVNFFRVNDAFILVDLPGYGYARVSKEKRAEWRPLIEGFMRSSQQLRGIVLLLDVRHDPTSDDRQMLDFLSEIGVPTIVVLTKIDKLTTKQRADRVFTIARDLALDAEQVIPFSAVTGEGRNDLGEAVESLLAQPSWRTAAASDQSIASDVVPGGTARE
jgi:GTP-binding protein